MKSDKRNERGIALISVMILITVLALLAGSLLHLAYLGYSRKAVEKKNNENFYCAEAVIDTIKTTLQNSVALSIPKADVGQENFSKYAYAAIVGGSYDKLKSVATNGTYNAAKASSELGVGDVRKNLKDYLFTIVTTSPDKNYAPKMDVNKYDGSNSTMVGRALTPSNMYFYAYPSNQPKKGGWQESSAPLGADPDRGGQGNGGSFDVKDIILYKDKVVIQGVSIKYVNDQGYTATISTDIVINAPKYIKAGDAPAGSYSMFAGSGGEVGSVAGDSGTPWALGNALYLHQEGNGYFGSMIDDPNTTTVDESHTSFIVGSTGGKGYTMLSFDGTNIIFNGDLIVKNGDALIFTGGDGTSTATVQVHGFIVLENGASLFLASNVQINCLGIVSSVSYTAGSSSGNVKKYVKVDDKTINAVDSDNNVVYTATITPYNPNGAEETVAQLYPLDNTFYSVYKKNEKVKDDNGTELTGEKWLDKFYNNEVDVQQLLNIFRDKYSSMNTGEVKYLNERYYNVVKGITTASAVYRLNDDDDGGKGWKNRTSCYYSKVGILASDDKINCSLDEKLIPSNKVHYDGNDYDPEFFRIVNVPLLKIIKGAQDSAVTFSAQDYSPCPDDNGKYVYTETTWDDVKTGKKYTYLKNQINWDDLSVYDTLYPEYAYSSRKIRIPTTLVNVINATFPSTVEGSAGKFKLESLSSTGGGGVSFCPNTTFQPSASGVLAFFIQHNMQGINVTPNIKGGSSSGILISANKVTYTWATGFFRVISLVDLAKKCGDGKTIADDGNQVHEMLEKLGAGMISYTTGDKTNFKTTDKEMCMIDNMFNGGIDVFWLMGASDGPGKLDNNGKDLIEQENTTTH